MRGRQQIYTVHNVMLMLENCVVKLYVGGSGYDIATGKN